MKLGAGFAGGFSQGLNNGVRLYNNYQYGKEMKRQLQDDAQIREAKKAGGKPDGLAWAVAKDNVLKRMQAKKKPSQNTQDGTGLSQVLDMTIYEDPKFANGIPGTAPNSL